MTSTPLCSIAIIGGGASATLFIAALARYGASASVDVYDRTGRFARGIAYATPHDCHLLNVRAGNMSGFVDDKDHFARWAAAYHYTPLDFVPRTLYGDYLHGLLDDARGTLNISLIAEDVLSSADNVVNSKAYDHVVLATGNVVPLGPEAEPGLPGYLPDPWALDETHIKNVRSIALVGTGLTAVDAVLTLERLGYTGTVTMISRRTLLPASHEAPALWPHQPLSADDAGKPLSHLLGMVRMHVREAASQDIPWQAVIDSLRAVTNPLWQNFSAAQRARFSRRLLTLWNVHRHRMAPSIAAQVELLRREGRLTFIRDAVTRVAPGPVVDGVHGTYPFDLVINCMGYRYHESGRAYDTPHKIGPARFGELFETTAIPEIRAQTDALARTIAGA